ncbi:hypothetical protein ANCCAN_03823, partial [Ancylostoma caninum]
IFSFSATSVQYAGVLIGNFIVGYCADKFGRRLVLLAALLLGIPELFLCGIIKNLIVYYVLRFAIGLSVAGTMSVGWTYCSEMISPQHRFKLRTITSYVSSKPSLLDFNFKVFHRRNSVALTEKY